MDWSTYNVVTNTVLPVKLGVAEVETNAGHQLIGVAVHASEVRPTVPPRTGTDVHWATKHAIFEGQKGAYVSLLLFLVEQPPPSPRPETDRRSRLARKSSKITPVASQPAAQGKPTGVC